MNKSKIKWLIIIALGLWITVDGVGSIIIYIRQSPLEHLVRVVRTCAGVILIYISADKLRLAIKRGFEEKGRGR